MVMELKDGRIETVMEPRDFLCLAEEYMGFEARRWIEDCLSVADSAESEIEELEKYYEGRIDRMKDAMRELRGHSEKLAGLIREKELDRRAISNTAGEIGVITWRELR